MKGLDIEFSKDPEINQVVINSEFGLIINSIAGSNISSIKFSGVNITITDLCMFTSQSKLPNLNHLQIQRATLVNFKWDQFGNCNIDTSNKVASEVDVSLN